MIPTHTPGPWTVRSWNENEHYIPEVWVRDFGDHIGDSIVRLADARLMAAAPDLLEALRGVMNWWAETSTPNGVDDEMPPKLFDAAWLAIARATRKA